MQKLSQVREPITGFEVKDDIATIKGFEWIFNNVVSVALALAGIVLFIMIVFGGFQYLTAGGDPKKSEGARRTLTYAIGGIVLVVLSFFIMRLIETITGVEVTKFNVAP